MTMRSSRPASPPPTSSGKEADFYICAVRGLGLAADTARVAALLDSLKPDVVMVQACPTRLALASHASSGHMSAWGGRRCGHRALVAWLWRRLAERGCVLVGRLDVPAHAVGLDWSDAVGLAADCGVRVVLGDRDVLRTIDHAWNRLGFVSRVRLLLELAVCSVLPASLVARVLVGPPPRPLVRRNPTAGAAAAGDASGDADTEEGNQASADDDAAAALVSRRRSGDEDDEDDPYSAAVHHFGRRFGGLEGLAAEQEDYLLSSLGRLDAPLATLCPTCPDHRRARVLAVLGPATARAVGARLHDLALSPCGGGGSAPNPKGRTLLSSAARRDLARAHGPAWRARLLLPLAVALCVLGAPVVYAAALLHARLAPDLADTLQTLASSATRSSETTPAGNSGGGFTRQQGFYTDQKYTEQEK